MLGQTDTDLGDFLKAGACSAVILQSLVTLIFNPNLPNFWQGIIGSLYLLTKFTAPAFIFGIVYSTLQKKHLPYQLYLKKQFHSLVIPSICWTSIYLIFMPQLQQHQTFSSPLSFIWQFVNGNAAPHLWYNTMMLQIILIMPFLFLIRNYVGQNKRRAFLTFFASLFVHLSWIALYNSKLKFSSHNQAWYLLDRVFIAFLVYGIMAVLSINFQESLKKFLTKSWPFLLITWAIFYLILEHKLHKNNFALNFNRVSYYQIKTTIYSLLVIFLICSLAFYQLKNKFKLLSFIHFLATYAYRAFLAHMFWLELEYCFVYPKLLKSLGLGLTILILYIATWLLSFGSAYLLSKFWSFLKNKVSLQTT